MNDKASLGALGRSMPTSELPEAMSCSGVPGYLSKEWLGRSVRDSHGATATRHAELGNPHRRTSYMRALAETSGFRDEPRLGR